MAKKKPKPTTAATKSAKPKKTVTKTVKPKKTAAKTAKPTKAAIKTVKPKKTVAKTAKPTKAGPKVRPKPLPARKKPIPKKPVAAEPILAPITTPPSEELPAQEPIGEPAEMPMPAEMEEAEAAMTEPMPEEFFGEGEERDGVLIEYEVETIVEVDVHRSTRPEDDKEPERPTQVPPGPLPIPPTQAE